MLHVEAAGLKYFGTILQLILALRRREAVIDTHRRTFWQTEAPANADPMITVEIVRHQHSQLL